MVDEPLDELLGRYVSERTVRLSRYVRFQRDVLASLDEQGFERNESHFGWECLNKRRFSMAGYVVASVKWNDADAASRYYHLVVDSLKPFNGKYLARGAPVATLEGGSAPARLAILEFPTAERAGRWHESEEYASARKVRERFAETYWIVVMEQLTG